MTDLDHPAAVDTGLADAEEIAPTDEPTPAVGVVPPPPEGAGPDSPGPDSPGPDSPAPDSAGSVLDRARAEAEAIVADATRRAVEEVEQARERAMEMIAEARSARDRMLSELTRRRHAAQVDLDRLRAARERLLAAYKVVRDTLDVATGELSVAETEARAAAEEAGRKAQHQQSSLESVLGSTGAARLRQRAEDDEETDRPSAEKTSPSPAIAEPAPPGPAEEPAGRRIAAVLRPAGDAGLAGGRPSVLPIPGRARGAPAPAISPPPAPRIPAISPPPDLSPPVAHDDPDPLGSLFARIRGVVAPPRPPETDPPSPDPDPSPDPPSPDPAAAAELRVRRDAVLEPLDDQLVRVVKRFLRDSQNELLDDLRRTVGPVPVSDPHAGRAPVLAAMATPTLAAALAAGAALAADSPADASADEAAVLAAALAAEVTEVLDRALARALTDPGGQWELAEVAEKVSSVYRQWRGQDLLATVRRHTHDAMNLGAYRATPAEATVRWVADMDGSCPDCDDNVLAGPQPRGEEFPTGQTHPPAHGGCRCLLVIDGS